MSPTCLILCCEWMLVAILNAEYYRMYLLWPGPAAGRFRISCPGFPPVWRQLCRTQTSSSLVRRYPSTLVEFKAALFSHHLGCIWKVSRTCRGGLKLSTRSDSCRRSIVCFGLQLGRGWTSSSRSSAAGSSCPGWWSISWHWRQCRRIFIRRRLPMWPWMLSLLTQSVAGFSYWVRTHKASMQRLWQISCHPRSTISCEQLRSGSVLVFQYGPNRRVAGYQDQQRSGNVPHISSWVRKRAWLMKSTRTKSKC